MSRERAKEHARGLPKPLLDDSDQEEVRFEMDLKGYVGFQYRVWCQGGALHTISD